ncbi:MarR family transcriptional regulator [Micrococcales bacterium 31B]|nr:MarR family transcriptional regulator [Micrococcales bacterium 31B]
MPAPRLRDQLVQAARLYYEHNLSQAEVAKRLDVSRSNVSRILEAARQQGIVEIRIHDLARRLYDLEDALVARFGLADCRVAGVGPDETPLHAVGKLGAEWLMENLPETGGIGLTWGAGVQATIDCVPHTAHPALTVMPLVGGLSVYEDVNSGDALVRELAGRLGAHSARLFAPAIVESRAARDTLLNESSIGETLERSKRVRVAVAGIGCVGVGASRSIIEAMKLSPTELAAFDAARPVGDMAGRYFTAEGVEIEGSAADRVLGVSIADLRRIPKVLGVAAGHSKRPGVLGAIRTGALDALVVDAELAAALVG